MKSIKLLMAITLLLSFFPSFAQIKNAKTESVKISGTCEMCKTTIEKAGNVKNTVMVDWNIDTQLATLTYDQNRTNQDEILKRIALSGYDNEEFLAPNDAYEKLPACCQYERTGLQIDKIPVSELPDPQIQMAHNHAEMNEMNQEVMPLKLVFENYFAIKDALTKTDGIAASTKATELVAAINGVKMEKLSSQEHSVWMKIAKDLAFDAEHIAETKDPSHQRDHFMTLSENMYGLMKVSKTETPIYYQFCPMANSGKGANWLSKENVVKNPYYGTQMLTCGKVVETIK